MATTYEDYWCLMHAHGCECVALTPAQWAALQQREAALDFGPVSEGDR